MKYEIVAKRYAEGLLAYLTETIGIEKGVEELKEIRETLRDIPSFKEFLTNQQITTQEKYDTIDKVFQSRFSQETIQFLKMLIEKKRMKEITDIIDYAIALQLSQKEIAVALRTAHALEGDLIEKLKRKLMKKLKKNVHLTVELAPRLIGGAQVFIGNKHIDGSLRYRLTELKEKLSTIKV